MEDSASSQPSLINAICQPWSSWDGHPTMKFGLVMAKKWQINPDKSMTFSGMKAQFTLRSSNMAGWRIHRLSWIVHEVSQFSRHQMWVPKLAGYFFSSVPEIFFLTRSVFRPLHLPCHFCSMLHAICSILEPIPDQAACYLQHFGAGTFHFVCYLQHLGAGTFHVECYLQHF